MEICCQYWLRGWDDWMISPMQWTWTWANSGRWWGTGRPGVLQSMWLQSRTLLSDWTTLTILNISSLSVVSDSLQPHGLYVACLSGLSGHGILQARMLEWVAIPFFRGSSWSRGWTHVSYITCTGRQLFTTRATNKQANPETGDDWLV